MKKFKEFILEQSTKMITVDYKIIVKDLKDNPILLVTDFNIENHEDKKMKIKAKGYIKTYLNGEGKKTKGWIAFDDFKDNTTRMVWNKNFENGSKRIKIYK
jgi:hypothetical protein